jgi:hypothetical protein
MCGQNMRLFLDYANIHVKKVYLLCKDREHTKLLFLGIIHCPGFLFKNRRWIMFKNAVIVLIYRLHKFLGFI